MIVVQLNAKLMPFDRGQYFEDPLDEALRAKRIGEVTGGGTMQAQSGEISYCDIEIEAPTTSIPFIVETLESLGAPKGSFLKVADSTPPCALGILEGIALYLNGTDLSAEVYESCDVNFVASEIDRLLETDGEAIGQVLSHWEGPTETALYIYGVSFAVIMNRIGDFLATYPLCQRCRVVQIA